MENQTDEQKQDNSELIQQIINRAIYATHDAVCIQDVLNGNNTTLQPIAKLVLTEIIKHHLKNEMIGESSMIQLEDTLEGFDPSMI